MQCFDRLIVHSCSFTSKAYCWVLSRRSVFYALLARQTWHFALAATLQFSPTHPSLSGHKISLSFLHLKLKSVVPLSCEVCCCVHNPSPFDCGGSLRAARVRASHYWQVPGHAVLRTPPYLVPTSLYRQIVVCRVHAVVFVSSVELFCVPRVALPLPYVNSTRSHISQQTTNNLLSWPTRALATAMSWGCADSKESVTSRSPTVTTIQSVQLNAVLLSLMYSCL